MPQYESQATLPAKWRVDGGGSDLTIKILNDKMSEKVTEYVKKLAGNGGYVERHSGFKDFTAEFTVLVDSTALLSDPAGGTFQSGIKGSFFFPVSTDGGSPDKYFGVHVMCLEASYDLPNDEMLACTIKIALDASANCRGTSSPFNYPS